MMLMFHMTAFSIVDNFDDGRDDGWTPIQGKWKVVNGRYVQSDIPYINTNTLKCYNRSFMGDVNWTDYTVEVDVRIDDPGPVAPIAGIFVRVTEKTDQGHYYFFRIDTRPDQAPAAVEAPNNNFKGQNGGKTEGANANDGLKNPAFLDMDKVGVEYHLKVVAEGNKFSFYIDDELILERVDDVDPILKGAVGLGTFNCGASFDNFSVQGPGIISVNNGGSLATTWGCLKRI